MTRYGPSTVFVPDLPPDALIKAIHDDIKNASDKLDEESAAALVKDSLFVSE